MNEEFCLTPWAFANQFLYLTNIVFGSSLTRIGDDAFASCNLTSLTIPKSVTSLGDYTFQNCSHLKAVYFQGNPPTFLGIFGADEFSGDANAIIYYPIGTTGWSFSPLVPYFMVRNGGFDDTGNFAGWTVSGNGSSQVTGPNVY